MGQFIDLTGQTFNRLTVIRATDRRQSGAVVWECQCSCGKTSYVSMGHLRNGHTKSCGCYNKEIATARALKQKGKDSPNWKGGKIRTTKGYIIIHQPQHPHCDCKGYVMQHRLVCEKIHGLLPRESTIHHINGIKDDNRPENLWIFENSADHIAFHHWEKKYAS